MKIKNSYLSLALLLLGAVILVYFTPNSVSKILFPFYCLLFYNSKKNAVWIVFFFILLEVPGGLFSIGTIKDLQQLPIYNLAAGVSITFEHLFILTCLMKVFKRKLKYKPLDFLSQNLKLMAFYFVFLLFLSFLLGISFQGFRYLYKITINLTLFYSFYFLFTEESDFVDFFKLVFPLAFVALLLQLYGLIFGHQLITLFKPGILSTQGVLGVGESNRPIEMAHILLVTFFGSLYYLLLRNKIFNRKYLLMVNVISFSSIFLTGTRTWFVAFTLSYLLLFLFLPGKMLKITLKNSIVLVMTIFTLFSFAILKTQFSRAYKRINTMEMLVKGDITAGGTSDRFDVQGPKVMKAFAQSTILFGAGFTELYWREGTGHVGYQNLLLNTGIIGILIILFFMLKTLYLCFKLKTKLAQKNPYKDSMIILFVWLMTILIINGSAQMIGYDVSLARILLLCIFIYFFNNQAKNALTFFTEKSI